MQFDFNDQTVIVTGGTRGIGRAIAEAFLKSGARVLVTFQGNTEAAKAFEEANQEHADRLIVKQCDVTDYAAVEELFKWIGEELGVIQVLINNSGIRRDQIVGMMAQEEWQSVIDTNLTGTFYMSKFAVQNMARKRYGRIVNITSPVARFGMPGQGNYAASKAGQIAFAASLSKETARRKITVNCVSPGFIGTDLIADLPEERVELYLNLVPMKRFGEVEEVASSVLYLASKEASYITGTVLEVTGGL
ncbi:MAG: SDR family oxidoreductase [Candidatus Nitronauta litoralis]|uniref:SDR family oxidoreductase n=1 Tax=Candidatus Nitronauta litoralis TaxID=2705533 RepID=A0A7T0BZE2_9BACT|nr:MAG: SDR family oxidoreductase [Candidatus Nitronauta litoralis]